MEIVGTERYSRTHKGGGLHSPVSPSASWGGVIAMCEIGFSLQIHIKSLLYRERATCFFGGDWDPREGNPSWQASGKIRRDRVSVGLGL